MKKLKVYLILFFLFTVPVVAKSIDMTPKYETNKVYIEAENQFKNHNYQEAFALYKKITKSKVSEKLKKKSGLKALETLLILKKWDNLITDLDNYIKVNHNNIWQARAYTLSGKIYQSMPSEGYKRNGKIYRDTTIRDGEYISTYDQDRKLALQSFQKSKEIYYLLQKPSPEVNQYTPPQELYQEVIDLNFEFANFLTSKSYYYISDYESLSNSTKIKVISNQYNPKSDVKVQIIFLYDEIFSLNRIAKNPHNEAMSLFKKASYYMNNNGIGAIYKKIKYKTKNNLDLTNNLPLSEDPIPLLLKIVNNYPNDDLAPESLLGLGNIYSSKQDFIKALNTYESLIRKYPSSIKVSDAKAEIQNIKRTSLSVGSLGVQQSDTKPKLSITTKNISNLTVKVYKTDLVKVLKNKLNDQNTNFNNFNHNFGEKINDAKRYFKEKVLSIDINMGDREDYKAVSKEITLSALKTGSYLVLTEDNKNNSSLTLLIISDIVIIKNIDKSKVYLNVLNRETGKPIPNVNVIIKEHYYTSNSYQSRYKQVFTDSNGSVIYNKKNDTTYSSYIEALAWQGNQLTFSDAQYYYNYYNQTKEYKSYLFTDRPVYRPEQTVYFKDIIRFHDGNYKNVPNEKINVKISDPKGTSIYEKVLTTNKLGSINDSFKLPKKADLGIYNIYTSFVDPNHTREALSQSSGQNFRVEEYKKPEYIVNVKSDNPQIKPGDKAKVKINVNYYFGSPVVAAKVHYKVMRSPFYYYYYKGSQYDWLYGSNSGYEKMYNPSLAQSESTGIVYKEGDLITDSAGNAYIDFETEKSLTDYKYDILANVVDSSRREIKGAGTVKVTQTYFYAFIDFDQGFYEPYENATVEVNLRSPDDQPVKATGDLKIYKVNYTGKNNEKENINLASSQSFTSDDEGRIFYRWKTPSEGYYKFVFETKDKDEKVVKGERYVWINGKNFQGKSYKFQNIEILTDKRTYQEGDTARIMISTDFAKSYILLSTETDNTILNNKLIYLPNKSKVLELKINKQHIPNFNIKAVMIRHNQLFMENREIFVPPAKQFLKVELSTDKKEYLPGDNATMTVKTTNSDGKPVPAEVSLSLVDSSVYYIQEDISEDIKLYYYGNRRAFQNSVTSSLNSYFYGLSETLEKDYPYQRHGSLFGYYAPGGSMDDKESAGSPMVKSDARSRQEPAKMSFAKNKSQASPSPVGAMKKDQKQQPELKVADIRSYFPDTAVWKPTLSTNKQGIAKLEFKFPDSVTTWRSNANAIDLNSRVGSEKKDIVTRKNILVRMQAPRFFVERDEIVLSALVNNDLDTDKKVECTIDLGDALENTQPQKVSVTVPAKGEKRIDWRVKVKKEGNVKITMQALTDEESDAVQMSFPVYIHGIEKYITKNGTLKNESSKNIDLVIPKERKKGSTTLDITLSPSVMSTIMEAIPYLATYPYGCVEQTTSRFIPLVLISKTLKNMNVDLNNLQKNKDFDTAEMTKWMDKKARNPIYNNEQIEDMVREGLEKLYTFQNGDGGFGWWTGFSSDPYMSAYVVHGLLLARDAKYQVNSSVLERALQFLSSKYKTEDVYYDRLYISYVLSMAKAIKPNQLEPLFVKRDTFNSYGKALLSLSYANLGDKTKADLICQNLKSFAIINQDSQTASWDNDQAWYWHWYGDRIETNSFILKAFLKSRPNDNIVPMLAKWLITNREGNHWYSTKDTANTIYALSDYAVINKETSPDYTLSVIYNDKVIKKIKVNKDNMFTFDNQITLNDEQLASGTGKLTIKKEGKGSLYYSASLKYFSLEENIKAASSQLSVKREYFKLTEKKDKDQHIIYDKTPISYDQVVKSGDLFEVKLTLKANNDYEYLIFEDMKPSGFEATDLKSGYVYQNGISLNKELRDEKVVFFMNNFPQGTQVLNYRLRAEIPGKFHVLPHKAYAMYAPKVRATSDEMKVQVTD